MLIEQWRRHYNKVTLPDNKMRAYPVSTQVNTPKHDEAELIEEVRAA